MRLRNLCENPAFNTRVSMEVSQSGSSAGDEFEHAATDRNREFRPDPVVSHSPSCGLRRAPPVPDGPKKVEVVSAFTRQDQDLTQRSPRGSDRRGCAERRVAPPGRPGLRLSSLERAFVVSLRSLPPGDLCVSFLILASNGPTLGIARAATSRQRSARRPGLVMCELANNSALASTRHTSKAFCCSDRCALG